MGDRIIVMGGLGSRLWSCKEVCPLSHTLPSKTRTMMHLLLICTLCDSVLLWVCHFSKTDTPRDIPLCSIHCTLTADIAGSTYLSRSRMLLPPCLETHGQNRQAGI